jgi:hypothetical protein
MKKRFVSLLIACFAMIACLAAVPVAHAAVTGDSISIKFGPDEPASFSTCSAKNSGRPELGTSVSSWEEALWHVGRGYCVDRDPRMLASWRR